jgi:hypothetical protein
MMIRLNSLAILAVGIFGVASPVLSGSGLPRICVARRPTTRIPNVRFLGFDLGEAYQWSLSPDPGKPIQYPQADPVVLKAGNVVEFQVFVDWPSQTFFSQQTKGGLIISGLDPPSNALELRIVDIKESRGATGIIHELAILVALSAHADAPVKRTPLIFRHPVEYRFNPFYSYFDSLVLPVDVVPKSDLRSSTCSSIDPLDLAWPMSESHGCLPWPPDHWAFGE